MLLTPDGRLEWPNTLHVWLIQGTALSAGVLGLIGYVGRHQIASRLEKKTPTAQAALLLGVLVFIEMLLGLAFWLTSEHPGFSDWGYLYNLFHLDLEFNVPAFFSVAQFWFGAALAIRCFRRSRMFGDNSRQDAIAWISAAAVMILLGLDELLSIHEDAEILLVATGIVGPNFDHRLGGYGWAWTLVGLPVALVCGAWFLWRFYAVFRYRKPLLLLLLIAGVVFLIGSVFMENLQVYFRHRYGLAKSPKILLLIEELLEMFGVSLAIYVFFLHGCQLGRASYDNPSSAAASPVKR